MFYYTIYRENIWEAWSLAGPVVHMTSDLQANIFIPNVIKATNLHLLQYIHNKLSLVV